ncbi:MAG: 16S rRNA (cytidine(1402)-2'-O)-methyltransferase [Bacilli bacterium]|nr:16S rRNA (cytidine(1402)-2'-O)-methyltransferase [Bacilli bacterium]
MIQKSYDGKATLFLIPTPIGNLEDITLRAIHILKEVEVIFSEDTRVTRQLIKHLNIDKKLISSHLFNENKNKDILLSYLNSGMNVGLVSDRGTPIISDPGFLLVKEAIDNNFNVVSLPGPTALIPALTVSGINPSPFIFIGFLNNKKNQRKKELEKYAQYEETLIIYEAPHRIKETLTDIIEIMGNRNISISREISKKYEEIYRGKIEELFDTDFNIKGEFVVVIEGQKKVNNYSNLTVIEHVNLYLKEGKSSKEAIKLTAKDRNVNKTEIYNIYHNIK